MILYVYMPYISNHFANPSFVDLSELFVVLLSLGFITYIHVEVLINLLYNY